MKQDNIQFIINPDEINKYFEDFEHKSPFNLYKCFKEISKEYKMNGKELYYFLSLEIKTAYENLKTNDYFYRSKIHYKIAIIKYRMKDDTSNHGKSKGWRIIALIDEINGLFYLLEMYKHSKGKDNLTNDEKNKIKLFCDEYAMNV